MNGSKEEKLLITDIGGGGLFSEVPDSIHEDIREQQVAVMLSSYNGSKYISAQIDSILLQKGVKVKLFIRDDGSTDNTQRIISEYEENHENVLWINRGEVKNLGERDSFFGLLRYAYENYPDIAFFSFADQDDVWLPEKLKSGIDAIGNSSNAKGALYYGNKLIVDEKLHIIEEENIVVYNDYLEMLWHCQAAGCTFVFNRDLAEYINKYNPTVDCIHDGWIFRLAKCIGSDIIFDENRYMMYRQHGENVVGHKPVVNTSISPSHLLSVVRRRLFEVRDHGIQNIIREIYTIASNDIIEEYKGPEEIVFNYSRSLKYKWKMLHFDGIKKRSFKLRVSWVDKVMNNFI